MRVCSHVGCPTLSPTAGRCDAHKRQARAARVDNRAYSTAGHAQFRAAVLKRDPTCVLCHIARSTVADHYPLSRRELVERGLDPNDPKRGRGLCKRDHDQHTARTAPGGWANRS